MKNLKQILCLVFVLGTYFACTQDDDNTDYVNVVAAPVNVSVLTTVTQDNSGLVTILPTAKGATSFLVNYGDGSTDDSVTFQSGQSTERIYAEGTYVITVTAIGINGKTTTITQDLVVSFIAPQNLVVTIENDSSISKQVNLTASAEFAMSYEVDFGEAGSAPVIGNIEDTVLFQYQEAGTYTITVTAFSAAIETTSYTEEFVVTEILQPIVAAPAPIRPASNVISIYSDAYTPITTTEFPTSWSQTGFEEIQVEGDNVIKYSELAFTGIVTDYSNATDLTNMDFVHFDYWTADASELSFKIVNTVANPAQEDIQSSGTITQGEWVSIDIALDDYAIDRSQVTQLLFDTLGNTANVFIDNLYFYVDAPTMPLVAAPTPTINAANVISIYSDAYTPINVTEFPTSWSDTGFQEIQVQGNNIVNYFDLAFTGIVTDYGNPTDLTGMDFVHFDYWSPNASTLGLKLVNTAANPVQEDIESPAAITLGTWVSVDIPLDNYAIDRSQVTQILFDALGNTANLYIDNLYFYSGSSQATEPTNAAPTPTVNTANVISIYSDAYTPINVTEFPTTWSGSGFEEVQLQGNNTIKYFDLDFTGIVTDYGNPTDLSGMTHVHFDYWTADGTQLGIKLVNTVANPVQEDLESVGTVTQGQWVSVDILLDDFAMDRSQVTQILFDNLIPADASITVYIDNLYFYN
jgi:ribosomal protein S8E